MNIDLTHIDWTKVTTQTLIAGLVQGGIVYGTTKNTQAASYAFAAGLLSHVVTGAKDNRSKKAKAKL